MNSHAAVVVRSLALLLSVLPTTLQYPRCSETFSVMVGRNITHCKKLPSLGAEFGWDFHPLEVENHSSRIDFVIGTRLLSDSGWLAWGVNPLGPQMAGTRAIIGIRHPDGSVFINTYNVTKDTKAGCRLDPLKIELEARNMAAVYMEEEGYFTLSATLIIGPMYDVSRLNHVWQVGYAVAEGMYPRMHPKSLQNFESAESIDLETGEGKPIGGHTRRLRMVHGIVNIIGWGVFLPIGAIIARYYRKYPFQCKAWWFEVHVSCQIIGYILGSCGWAIGLLLGHASKNYRFTTHRNLAILIFTFTTLQTLALRLRPKVDDPYRKYWNIYHHFLGYALLILIAVNIFKGIYILRPENTIWKWSYSGIVGILTAITLSYEIYTWTKFLRERLQKSKPNQPTPGNGVRPSSSQPGTESIS